MTRSEYLRSRRGQALANGECTVCRKRGIVPERTRCEPCMANARAVSARIRSAKRSVAVLRRLNVTLSKPVIEPDVMLSKPSIRLLRALRWHDWVDPVDIEMGTEMCHPLGRLTREGRIERNGRLVRITEAGRQYLEQQLARTRPDPIVFELDVEVE